MKKLIPSFLLLFLLAGCATFYRPIKPSEIGFPPPEINADFSYSLKFDPLLKAGNPRFAKKEEKTSISVVALKITNNSERDLTVGKDILFYLDHREIVALEPIHAASQLALGSAGYMLYSLLFLYIRNDNKETVIPIGVPIGLGNLIVATNTNNKLEQELVSQNIIYKTIKPNETIYGLAAFRDIKYGKLTLKTNEN
ncbi:MAG: hypothetical protein PHQ65_04765 [Bacteroidales bacterium]|nr:hypothetical protein [Bacteroidales bacterium]MDD3664554.1 hypothetical protein [Bacteroidales bacterium]